MTLLARLIQILRHPVWTVLALVGVSIGLAILLWTAEGGPPVVMDSRCRMAYARAETSADTARVDRLTVGFPSGAPSQACGFYRHMGESREMARKANSREDP